VTVSLPDFWYLLIAVLWIGYFFLEGFDFGVGILTRVLARDDVSRRVLLNTIGPVWDGNEVWLITAVGATFAAFPDWYATMLSAFYLPVLLILVALILRNVAFEYRHKQDDDAWRRNWDRAIFWGSLVPALMWGLIFGNMFSGIGIGADKGFTGTVLDFVTSLDGLVGALATLALFVAHGAVFVSLKTVGDIRDRARRIAVPCALAALVLTAVLLVRINGKHGSVWSWTALVLALVALAAVVPVIRMGREGWAFLLSGLAVAATFASLFLAVFPNVMPSSLNPAWTLTVAGAASTHYTLKIMSWVAVCFTPIVLVYQGWTYWVFRKRIGTHHIPLAH
jgi:cytochrome bd ubiquinol oxidase subunit II